MKQENIKIVASGPGLPYSIEVQMSEENIASICKDLVVNLYETEPTLNFTILSKCAVLEIFSLGDLKGRKCMGRSTTTNKVKQPLDKIKLHFIQESVFKIYPQRWRKTISTGS